MQITLWVAVGVIEMLILEALLAVSRRVGREAEPADAQLGLSRWAAVARLGNPEGGDARPGRRPPGRAPPVPGPLTPASPAAGHCPEGAALRRTPCKARSPPSALPV